ncbi:unnamed protein product [Phaeothamnion confervicola]
MPLDERLHRTFPFPYLSIHLLCYLLSAFPLELSTNLAPFYRAFSVDLSDTRTNREMSSSAWRTQNARSGRRARRSARPARPPPRSSRRSRRVPRSWVGRCPRAARASPMPPKWRRPRRPPQRRHRPSRMRKPPPPTRNISAASAAPRLSRRIEWFGGLWSEV